MLQRYLVPGDDLSLFASEHFLVDAMFSNEVSHLEYNPAHIESVVSAARHGRPLEMPIGAIALISQRENRADIDLDTSFYKYQDGERVRGWNWAKLSGYYDHCSEHLLVLGAQPSETDITAHLFQLASGLPGPMPSETASISQMALSAVETNVSAAPLFARHDPDRDFRNFRPIQLHMMQPRE